MLKKPLQNKMLGAGIGQGLSNKTGAKTTKSFLFYSFAGTPRPAKAKAARPPKLGRAKPTKA